MEIHPDYTAHDINWLQWAAWIESQPLHLRDEKAKQAPPPHLAHFFKMTPFDAGAVLNKLKTSTNVNRNMVERLQFEVGVAKQSAETMRSAIQLHIAQLERLGEIADTAGSVIASFGDAISPAESEFGRSRKRK